MDKNRIVILAVVVVGIGAAIGLSRCSEGTNDDKAAQKKALGFEKRDVVYPRQAVAQRRVKQRRKKPLDTQRPPTSKATLDGLHRAFGGPNSAGTVFLEVNAIRYSKLAEGILKCRGDDVNTEVDRLKQELGIDPMEDVDRFAIQKGMVAATGNFENLTLPDEALLGPYGDGATLYELGGVEGASGAIAVINDTLVLAAGSPAEIKAAVDRVEGRAEAAATIPRALQNAEVYGRIDPAMIAAALSGSTDPVAAKFAEMVKTGFVRVNVDDEVSLSLDMQADDPDSAGDLAKAVGGAFAGLRKKAADDGEQELAWLLEAAEVRPGAAGRFEIDVAVPGGFVLDLLGCDKDGNPKPGQKPLGIPASENTGAPSTSSPTGLPASLPPTVPSTQAPLGGTGAYEPTLKPPTQRPLPGQQPGARGLGSSGGARGFPTVIDDGT